MPPVDSVRLKSLGVNTAATPISRRALRVAGRDDPADDHRHVVDPGLLHPRPARRAPAPCASRRGSRARRSARPRRRRRRRSARGSAGCPGRRPRSRRRGPAPPPARRRWSARRGRACRRAAAAGRRAPRRSTCTRSRTAASSLAPASATPTAPETPVGRAELAEHLAQRAGPLPRRRPGAGRDERGRHQVRVGLGVLGEPPQRLVDLGLVALPPSTPRDRRSRSARPRGRRPGSRRRGRR